MVLESLIFPLRAEKRPWELFFIGFVYASVAIILSMWVFQSQASIVIVLLIVMACIPLVYNTVRLEEAKDIHLEGERTLIKEHSKAIAFFLFLFMGITIATVVWYVALPSQLSAILFQRQAQTITELNNNISGGAVSQLNIFSRILLNNIKVLVFCIMFSFIYGSGAIFILTWNATVIGTAMGNFVRGTVASYAAAAGATTISHYFMATSLGIARYFIHGLPEVTAYFYAGLAGGIISIAIMHHGLKPKKILKILVDTSDLIIISFAFLVVAALFEVYLTPILF